MHHGTEEFDIKVTIILKSGGEFSAIFDSATKAFIAVYEYLLSDPRQCYYKDKYDDLMTAMLSVRYGKTTKNECSMFRVEAVKKEEN